MTATVRNREVIAFDLFHRIERDHGNHYVTVECERNEHPATVRSAALRYVREHMGADWHLCAWLGWEYGRRSDGYPYAARRYSVVRIGGAR